MISLDGTGEYEAGLLGRADGSGVRIMATIPRRESWGYLFGKLTELLGFTGHRDEGKVMGLAALGTPDRGLFDFIDWSRQVPRIRKQRLKAFLRSREPRRPGEEITREHMDLAATLQAAYERALLSMAGWLSARTGEKALCLAGGCGLNCAANGALAREGIFERIFVQPAAHDAGTALGAALEAHRRETGERASLSFSHPYFGPGYSPEEVERLISSAGLGRAEKLDDPAAAAARLLAGGKVIGWFQGRMEVGPRALGARSILADPRDPSARDRVNRIKGREPWRPLAPAILEEDSGVWLRERVESPFMLLAFTASSEALRRIPAVVHVDGTIRAQVLSREANPLFHGLITGFKALTGVGAVLNTSFNGPGEPIVCAPRDALQTFFSTGLDALIMECWKVEK